MSGLFFFTASQKLLFSMEVVLMVRRSDIGKPVKFMLDGLYLVGRLSGITRSGNAIVLFDFVDVSYTRATFLPLCEVSILFTDRG